MSNPRYKAMHKSYDATELRRRREEEGIQIRKAKREQQLIKRRNVNINQDANDDSIQVSQRFYG